MRVWVDVMKDVPFRNTLVRGGFREWKEGEGKWRRERGSGGSGGSGGGRGWVNIFLLIGDILVQ